MSSDIQDDCAQVLQHVRRGSTRHERAPLKSFSQLTLDARYESPVQRPRRWCAIRACTSSRRSPLSHQRLAGLFGGHSMSAAFDGLQVYGPLCISAQLVRAIVTTNAHSASSSWYAHTACPLPNIAEPAPGLSFRPPRGADAAACESALPRPRAYATPVHERRCAPRLPPYLLPVFFPLVALPFLQRLRACSVLQQLCRARRQPQTSSTATSLKQQDSKARRRASLSGVVVMQAWFGAGSAL